MAALIGFVPGEFEFEFFLLGLICAAVSTALERRPAGERLPAVYVLFSVGCLHAANFVYDVFFGAISARFTGSVELAAHSGPNPDLRAWVLLWSASSHGGVGMVCVWPRSSARRLSCSVQPVAMSIGS